MFPTYGYRPYLHSSYHNPPAFYGNSGYPSFHRQTYLDAEALARARERAEALAARRARRAQYLPYEDVVDSDEEDFHGLLNQRENLYLDARKQREEMLENERRKREAAAMKINAQRAAAEKHASEGMQRPQHSRAMSQQGPSVADQNVSSHGLSPSQSSQHHSIPIHGPGSPRRGPTPASSSKPQTPSEPSHIPTLPVVDYTQIHTDAAEKIQKKYRQHRALKVIDGVASQFEDAKSTFRIPDEIDFVDPQRPGQVVTVVTAPEEDTREADVDAEMITLDETETSGTTAISGTNGSTEAHVEASQSSEATVPSVNADTMDGDVETPSSDDTSDISDISDISDFSHISRHPELLPEPLEYPQADNAPTAQLAYTKLNYPLHGYAEKLSVLLLKLDGVESFGSKQVRERRKEVAKMIEREATRVENVWQDAWKRFWRKASSQ